ACGRPWWEDFKSPALQDYEGRWLAATLARVVPDGVPERAKSWLFGENSPTEVALDDDLAAGTYRFSVTFGAWRTLGPLRLRRGFQTAVEFSVVEHRNRAAGDSAERTP
ncbi:MAG: hypothetical protein ACI9MR_000153, partial [Myxococcota bacterium]